MNYYIKIIMIIPSQIGLKTPFKWRVFKWKMILKDSKNPFGGWKNHFGSWKYFWMMKMYFHSENIFFESKNKRKYIF